MGHCLSINLGFVDPNSHCSFYTCRGVCLIDLQQLEQTPADHSKFEFITEKGKPMGVSQIGNRLHPFCQFGCVSTRRSTAPSLLPFLHGLREKLESVGGSAQQACAVFCLKAQLLLDGRPPNLLERPIFPNSALLVRSRTRDGMTRNSTAIFGGLPKPPWPRLVAFIDLSPKSFNCWELAGEPRQRTKPIQWVVGFFIPPKSRGFLPGGLPGGLAQLRGLRRLVLDRCNLTGVVPWAMGQLQEPPARFLGS